MENRWEHSSGINNVMTLEEVNQDTRYREEQAMK